MRALQVCRSNLGCLIIKWESHSGSSNIYSDAHSRLSVQLGIDGYIHVRFLNYLQISLWVLIHHPTPLSPYILVELPTNLMMEVSKVNQRCRLNYTTHNCWLSTLEGMSFFLLWPCCGVLRPLYKVLMVPFMVHVWLTIRNLGLVTSYTGLIACRFFIGLFEGRLIMYSLSSFSCDRTNVDSNTVGGFLSGLILYLSSFYPRRILQLR